MNNKGIILIFLLLGLIVVFSSPVNAFSISKLDKNTVQYINNESVISTSIVSTDLVSDHKMKKDLNRIDKIVVKVNGKTVNIIKKEKGWDKNLYYPLGIIDRETKVKGNIKGKKVSILVYNNKNKLIKKQTNIVKSIRTTDFTETQVKKIGNKLLNDWAADVYGNSSVIKVNNAKYQSYGGIWVVNYSLYTEKGKKNGKTYIDGGTGKLAVI